MSGYIVFQHDKPFQHLLKHGFVYTLRATKRREGVVELRRSRSERPLGLVSVSFVGLVERMADRYVVVNPAKPQQRVPLESFVKYSGFDSLQEWLKAYVKLNGYVMFPPRLYKVQLVKLYNKTLDI